MTIPLPSATIYALWMAMNSPSITTEKHIQTLLLTIINSQLLIMNAFWIIINSPWTLLLSAGSLNPHFNGFGMPEPHWQNSPWIIIKKCWMVITLQNNKLLSLNHQKMPLMIPSIRFTMNNHQKNFGLPQDMGSARVFGGALATLVPALTVSQPQRLRQGAAPSSFHGRSGGCPWFIVVVCECFRL